jgi:hypothetical protein
MKHPYENLPEKAFWKASVATKNMFDIRDLWDPKFNIKPSDRVVTYGSCFAQHIGNALYNRGYNWLITERAPLLLTSGEAKLFRYNIFSCRTGNVYTTSLLKQWTDWSLGKTAPPSEVWQKNNRLYDPFRPRVEPNGFESEEELEDSRTQTILSFKKSVIEADYFVFTLGLTESWVNVNGYEYPICPGTVAGIFDADKHKFINQKFSQILINLSDAIKLMREINSRLRFILTVSPVPLTATKSDRHIVIATMASKSILRAVADQLTTNRPYIDYFPSYEIINSPVFKGIFFEPNQRNVSSSGVNFVMNNFFRCLLNKYSATEAITNTNNNRINIEKEYVAISEQVDEFCDEALLEAFGEKQ